MKNDSEHQKKSTNVGLKGDEQATRKPIEDVHIAVDDVLRWISV